MSEGGIGGVASAQRWFLPVLLCSDEIGQAGGRYPLDRIRMQKAVFLLTRRGTFSWRDLYSYEPYDWGPYCRVLTEDLRALAAKGLVRVAPAGGSHYGRYILTQKGQQLASVVWPRLHDEERAFLCSVRSYVTNKDFNSLLREVYNAYPEFATNSVWYQR
jgi:uncharacterized protein